MTGSRQNAQLGDVAAWLGRWQELWSISMKQLILAAAAVLSLGAVSLGAGSAFAQSYSHATPSQASQQDIRN